MSETRKIAAILVADGGWLQAGSPVVTAYTLDWANEVPLLGEFPNLRAYLERMYTRPNAPPRIAQALASITA